MDISDFHQTFFDEADELLAEMEKSLLELDISSPDSEMLNAIFRAAHSIKGGAGTFGFTVLQETTHILENLLNDARCGELELSNKLIDLFLETKDIMQEQLDAYKASQEPEQEAFHYICAALRQIALESGGKTVAGAPPTLADDPVSASVLLDITLTGMKQEEIALLSSELSNLGEIVSEQRGEKSLLVRLSTTESVDDLTAVLCFILEPDQIAIAPATHAEQAGNLSGAEPGVVPAVARLAQKAPTGSTPPAERTISSATSELSAVKPRNGTAESGSIRVAVEKVDQIINQVGELIITQSMLTQQTSNIDPALHNGLINSLSQLERNARDLQESVMAVRMMPMESVFSRFPRLVHDLANKLNKKVELTLKGSSAELDKSLIERIVDPLTHLVRNSLDHGLEPGDVRLAKGKSEKGHLMLNAEHHGGNIIIEVTDDGAGLNREKILARARAQGISLSENISDEEVWMLIFAPGFSTAEKVTDVSGRGVGMDVVRRNIQQMGGHVEIFSVADKGSTIRIVLPLTLAILDGMSVRVGDEIYVLPLGTVMESLKPSESALFPMAGGELVLKVRGEYLPLVSLKQLFSIPSEIEQASDGIAVILQSAGSRYALLVDQLIGQHQVVVKNLEQNYRKVPGISAATILGDGSIALILDVLALPALGNNRRVELPVSQQAI